jgi:CubicO group peptidase (beta-lactamase class C family)
VVEVHGAVAAGWGEVVDAFIVGFDGFDEIGASCCIYVEGRPVVDIWAGVADRRSGQPWMADTAAVIFSATKGATAICANLLVQRGQLDLDTKVSDYWPEFRGGGKEAIPVRWLLTHQAGLPGIDAELRQEDVLAWEPVIHALEAQDLVPTPVRRRNSATRGLPGIPTICRGDSARWKVLRPPRGYTIRRTVGSSPLGTSTGTTSHFACMSPRGRSRR